jgi:ATP-dependent Clp protease ATP-binding subunit ClpX
VERALAEATSSSVSKLIVGPRVDIGDECIDLGNEIIEAESAEATDLRFDELPAP